MFIYKYKIWMSFFLLIVSATSFYACSAGIEAPHSLVVAEGFQNPIGFYEHEPTFSWKLPLSDNVKSQSGYRIVVASDPELIPNKADLWDSRDVESDQSVWIKYNGSPLQSRQKAYWQVMFYDQDENSSVWSETASFELGLLNNKDWQAKWIALPAQIKSDTSAEGHSIFRPQYFRKDFILNSEIDQARLFITAKGVFEAQINGQKVGNDVMTPGWTPYKKRIETLSYDSMI